MIGGKMPLKLSGCFSGIDIMQRVLFEVLPSSKMGLNLFSAVGANAAKVDLNKFGLVVKEISSMASFNEENLRAAFLSMEEDANSGLLEAKEFEHILKTSGEPLKSTELDEVLKLVNLKNNRDIDYEGLAYYTNLFLCGWQAVVGPI